MKSLRLGEKPVRLDALSARLDSPTVWLGQSPVRLIDPTARLEEPAGWISESAMRLEAIAGAAKGVSRAVERLSRAVERASRAAGTFSRADKRARELAGKESWAVEETFMSARSMGETAEVPQWVEGSMRGTPRRLPESAG